MTMTSSKKYSEREIAVSIEREIIENKMVPGIRLPTASGFAKQYAVSLKTADRALCRLVKKGLVMRVRGSGSFVKTNRSITEKLRVAFVHWHYPHLLPELNYAAYFYFIDLLSRLLGEHDFTYEVFLEKDRAHCEVFGTPLTKFDVIIAPAGILELSADFLSTIKQHLILYSDDTVNYGPWNQVVFDYHPGFLKALQYGKDLGYRKFFLPGVTYETSRRRINTILECGRKLGFPDSAFHVYYAKEGLIPVGFLSGCKCANYYLEQKLKDHFILSSSDFISYGMVDVFSSHGMKPGRDFQLISYDNLESRLDSNFPKLGISGITHPLEAHADAIIAMLENLTRTSSRNYYQTYFTPATELVIRKTN